MQPLNLRLPPSLIPELQKPFGTFIKVEDGLPSPEQRVATLLQNESSQGNLVICVGDFVAKSLIKEQFIPDMLIIDNFTQRTKKADFELTFEHQLWTLENKPGEINASTWTFLKNELKNLKKSNFNYIAQNSSVEDSQKRIVSVIVIQGEEDLLVLPAILEAPIGSFVLYGQPPMVGDGSTGIVLIEITEEIKELVDQLLSKFTRI